MYFYLFKVLRINALVKYSASIAKDRQDCVIGSVEGVITALIIVESRSMYLHA